MFRVENTENFFLGVSGHLFIVYAYGNDNNTNELDVIIFY
jgi:hypothetical protein